MRRTHTCGQLRLQDAGSTVLLQGWVHRRRDHGGIIFIDLRDRYGLVQLVFNPQRSPQAHETASQVRSEYVLEVRGVVSPRPPGTENPNLATGQIEVLVDQVAVLNPSLPLPFSIADGAEVEERLRLEFRYLDLRRPRMAQILELRHRAIKFIRDFMDARGFLEIETPMLIKSTPEGARDYLVPSRLHPGTFYALPQSPQQLKQLLMVGGMDRYFQIARCMRDEDLRADRQPEFTQLDVEMSFVEQEDILEVMEALFTQLTETLTSKRVIKPWPRLRYQEAMDRYGTDKPDLRFGMAIEDISDLLRESPFEVFRRTLQSGGSIRAIRVPGIAGYSRRQMDELAEMARTHGARGLAWALLAPGETRSTFARHLAPSEFDRICQRLGAAEGDGILVVADAPDKASMVLGKLRTELGHRLGLADPGLLAWLWVTDFPYFEWDEKEQRITFVHHPFTMPFEEDIPLIESEPLKVRAQAYDIVCNGYEVASGSIRIHRREVQNAVFRALGYTDEEIDERFGHMLRAFEYGAPPHGGIAPGIDRVIMLLADEENIRNVIAFPKNQSAQDLMLSAPSEVSEEQLRELHLRVVHPEPVS